MRERKLDETVQKLLKGAMRILEKEGAVPLAFYIEAAKPVHFLPPHKKSSDFPKIAAKVKRMLAKSSARFYVLIAECSNMENGHDLVMVQGFHRNGGFLNMSIPFFRVQHQIILGPIETSKDPKTASRVFARLFD